MILCNRAWLLTNSEIWDLLLFTNFVQRYQLWNIMKRNSLFWRFSKIFSQLWMNLVCDLELTQKVKIKKTVCIHNLSMPFHINCYLPHLTLKHSWQEHIPIKLQRQKWHIPHSKHQWPSCMPPVAKNCLLTLESLTLPTV